MMKFESVLIWLVTAPITIGVVFVILNYVFYKEPVEHFLETNNVSELMKAIHSLESILVQNPSQSKKQLELAHCYKVVGRYKEAIDSFGKAWEIVQERPEELIEFADVIARYRDNNFKGRPIELLEKALKIEPTNVDVLIAYGVALFSTKQIEKAVRYWDKAYQLLEVGDARRDKFSQILKDLKR